MPRTWQRNTEHSLFRCPLCMHSVCGCVLRQLCEGVPAHSLCGLCPDTHCTSQDSSGCSSIIFPQRWSSLKPLILLSHKSYINTILYGFFHSVLGSSTLLHGLRNRFLIFLGISVHHYWCSLGFRYPPPPFPQHFCLYQVPALQEVFSASVVLKVLYKGSWM